jgi:type 1 glutamine amidotransferase
VVVLKGGAPNSWSRKSLPQKVEVKVGVPASRLHFLGGVAGWGYPAVGNDQLPALKVTVQFADGSKEELIQRNGQEIADYNGQIDVPKSKGLAQFTRGRGQIRWLSQDVKGTGLIEKLILESYDNAVAPTLFAITAENGPRGGAQPAGATPSTTASDAPGLTWGPGIKALIVGGGSSHDFERWFGQEDTKTLSAGGKASVNYTEQIPQVGGVLKDIDVLFWTSNQPMPDRSLRKAIFDFADSGKGLMLVHPGVWYAWPDWPEYNKTMVGGGSKGHDKYQEFAVTVTDSKHPIMAGVPATFKITDELYNHIIDAAGTPAQVLATATSPTTGKTFPSVWIAKHPKARIVCIALGHDGKAHENPAYQKIIQNSLAWAAGK